MPDWRLWSLPDLSSGLGTGRWLGASGWCEQPRDLLSGVLQVAGTGTALLAVVTC